MTEKQMMKVNNKILDVLDIIEDVYDDYYRFEDKPSMTKEELLDLHKTLMRFRKDVIKVRKELSLREEN